MLTFDAPLPAPDVADTPTTVLNLHGEIDVASGAVLRRTLRSIFERGERDVIVDIADVSFIDASGLGVLVGAYRLFVNAGGRLRIRNPQRSVRRVFEVTGLDQILGL